MHKIRKGDKVAVYIDLFKAHVPAVVTNVDKNLINVQTLPRKQGIQVLEKDVKLVKPVTRPRRLVYRYSRRKVEE
jgi:hypothetical protein